MSGLKTMCVMHCNLAKRLTKDLWNFFGPTTKYELILKNCFGIRLISYI